MFHAKMKMKMKCGKNLFAMSNYEEEVIIMEKDRELEWNKL